jgi:uncharacterized membrane protein
VTRDLPEGEPTTAMLASTQLAISTLIGLLAGIPVALFAHWEYAPLAGWDVTAAVYLTWVLLVMWHRDAEHTARAAVYADPTRAITDLILLIAAAVSLVAVALALARAPHMHDVVAAAGLLAVAGLLSIALSWAVVHIVFTIRYARLYYTGTDGGLDFRQPEPPKFSDFAYVSFTIGMTFQVSDTDLVDEEFRRTALRHALLSYLFGTGILAAAINVLASMTNP